MSRNRAATLFLFALCLNACASKLPLSCPAGTHIILETEDHIMCIEDDEQTDNSQVTT